MVYIYIAVAVATAAAAAVVIVSCTVARQAAESYTVVGQKEDQVG